MGLPWLVIRLATLIGRLYNLFVRVAKQAKRIRVMILSLRSGLSTMGRGFQVAGKLWQSFQTWPKHWRFFAYGIAASELDFTGLLHKGVGVIEGAANLVLASTRFALSIITDLINELRSAGDAESTKAADELERYVSSGRFRAEVEKAKEQVIHDFTDNPELITTALNSAKDNIVAWKQVDPAGVQSFIDAAVERTETAEEFENASPKEKETYVDQVMAGAAYARNEYLKGITQYIDEHKGRTVGSNIIYEPGVKQESQVWSQRRNKYVLTKKGG